ncbi:MAG: glutamate-5-semialdehyde dehydrogenase [Sphaerochaetaceae bacterium]|jgi:glutamate-5-semialdehyde dehydrogenase
MDQFQYIKKGQRVLGTTSLALRNEMLEAIASELESSVKEIEEANNKDLLKAQQENLELPLQKRLLFNSKKIASSVEGIRQVAALADPIGKVKERRLLDTGLLLERVDVPIGTIGMIFESRPDALVQIISLALKSGNGIVVKGGSEALQTNTTLVEIIRRALQDFSVGSDWIVHLTSREDVRNMLELDHIIDLLIPRGSNEFVRYIMENTHIPVLGHADGICAMYIDKEADVKMAVEVATDAKCQYPAVCNAIETLLVHFSVAKEFIPAFKESTKKWNVVIHGDNETQKLITCIPTTEEDWKKEYLDYEINIKVVASAEEAIDHIARYGSGHTDAIITNNKETAQLFLQEVDSADVFVNCSTRFADGFRFGLGAEVGISTQKIHARGPVGLEGLVTSKWILTGEGHTVTSYEEGERHYLHTNLPIEGKSMMEGSLS